MPQNFKTVVFVCTGNYYRSRFSEYLFNALAKKLGLFWQATSRGLKTWTVGAHEGPLSEFAAYRLTALDVPFDSQRFPIQLSEVDLEDADLVVALKKAEHHAMMLDQFPQWAERITYWHVDDLDCATADEALQVCESCVRFLAQTLLAEQQSQHSSGKLRRAA
jgi:protein-tyrosine phosphatase